MISEDDDGSGVLSKGWVSVYFSGVDGRLSCPDRRNVGVVRREDRSGSRVTDRGWTTRSSSLVRSIPLTYGFRVQEWSRSSLRNPPPFEIFHTSPPRRLPRMDDRGVLTPRRGRGPERQGINLFSSTTRSRKVPLSRSGPHPSGSQTGPVHIRHPDPRRRPHPVDHTVSHCPSDLVEGMGSGSEP